jgi:hypothetical protein
MSGLPMDGIPERYKVRVGEGWETLAQVEARLAGLENKLNLLESHVKTAPVNNNQAAYNGFLITRDLAYTTYKITDLQGNDVPGLSEGSFKNINLAHARIDGHNAIKKALNSLNGHSTTENNNSSS